MTQTKDGGATDLTTDALKRLADEIPAGPWIAVSNHPTNACAEVMQDGDWAIGIATLYGNHDDVPHPREGEPWGDMPVRDAIAEAIALVPALLRELIERREAVPEATTPTAQEAVPVDDELDEAWKSGFNAGFGEAKLTTNPPQPSVSVAEITDLNHPAIDAFWDAHRNTVTTRDMNGWRRAVRNGLNAALRALKGGE